MEFKSNIFWNFLKIFWRYKKFIIITCFSTSIIVLIITTLMPKTYKASLTFVVIEENENLNIASILGDLPFKLGGFSATNVDKYIAYLSSRRIRDIIIKEFDLKKVYGSKYIEQVYKTLESNVQILDNRDGTVTIYCYYQKYPEKASKMVLKFYEELYKLVLELNRQRSTEFREYIESNYINAQKRLINLEDSLKDYQLNNKVVEIESQTKMALNVIAELEAQKQEYRIKMDYLKKFGTNNNQQLEDLKSKYNILESNLNQLINSGENYIPALKNIPSQGLLYYRLYRDIQIQQKIIEFILPIYENAKMEEQKRTANIQLLDPPFVPQYKAKPKRLTSMILVTFFVFVSEIIFFTLKEAYKNNKNEIKSWLNEE